MSIVDNDVKGRTQFRKNKAVNKAGEIIPPSKLRIYAYLVSK